MKRIGQRALSLFLLAAVMLILPTSCGGGSNDGLAPTDKLVIYCPPTMNTEIKQAKAEFERKYPEIELSYTEFGSYSDEEANPTFREQLKVELLAGKGPDLVIFDRGTFDDLYKVLDANVFCDLNIFTEQDETFHMDHYLQSVYEGGNYQGKQLFVPLTFMVNYILADSHALSEKGVALSPYPSFSEWSEEMIKYMDIHATSEIQNDYEEWFRNFRIFFSFSGLQILDYETKEFHLDSTDLRLFIDTYKHFYRYPNNDLMDDFFYWRKGCGGSYGIWNAILEERQIYETYSFLLDVEQWITDYYAVPAPDTLFAFPQFTGNKSIAVGETFAAINTASPNKQNAYLFLKTILSTQAEAPLDSNNINKAGLAQTTSLSMVKALEGEAVEGYEAVLPLEYYRNYSNTLMDIVYARMEPYFRDEKSYEDCLAELQSALELYINE